MTDIVVSFYAPPIPWRGADYCAVRDGYDEGDPIGYGETEEEAIETLISIEKIN
jgi:hypothetical protein